jgi:hypothetical protein
MREVKKEQLFFVLVLCLVARMVYNQNILQLSPIPNPDPSIVALSSTINYSYDTIDTIQWGSLVVRANPGSNGLKIISMEGKVIAQTNIGQPTFDTYYRSLAVWQRKRILVCELAYSETSNSRVVFVDMQILASSISLNSVFDTTYPALDGNSLSSVADSLASPKNNYIYCAKSSNGLYGPNIRRLVKLDTTTQQIIPTSLGFAGTISMNHNFIRWLQDGVMVVSVNYATPPPSCIKYAIYDESTNSYFEVCYSSSLTNRQFMLVDNLNALTVYQKVFSQNILLCMDFSQVYSSVLSFK